MGFTDADKLAINTIRLLAVSELLSLLSNNYPAILQRASRIVEFAIRNEHLR
jgi:hypothetical protein